MDETFVDLTVAKDRFLTDQLVVNPGAKVLHFKPLPNGRDEFGNRIFTSSLRYFDRENREVKAALLVSPRGEDFIHANSRILQDIDRGLKQFSGEINNNKVTLLGKDKPTIELSPSRRLTWIDTGGQSQTFLLEADGKKYMVKATASLTSEYQDFTQPYINEMLQTLELGKALKEELKAANCELSSFLFSTGYMSVTEFVEGNHEIKPNNNELLIKLLTKAREFVKGRRKTKDPLWTHIDIDCYSDSRGERIPNRNMIQNGDRVVWVDPFYNETIFL